MTSSCLKTADFYVAPEGCDRWSGRHAAPKANGSDGPFATLDKARRAVRALRKQNPRRRKPIVVCLRGGLYELAKTIEFTPADSGTELSPTIYAAYDGETPVISGGRSLSGWSLTRGGRWRLVLPEVRDAHWVFRQLFVNGQRRGRPRRPVRGYYRIARDVGPPVPDWPETGAGCRKIGYKGRQFRDDFDNPQDIDVVVIQSWTHVRAGLEKVDADNGVAYLSAATNSADRRRRLGKNMPYYLENVAEALREPGTFYLDRSTGQLTYIPVDGEEPTSAQVIAPYLDTCIQLHGNPKRRRWVQHVRFEGLTLAHCRMYRPPGGEFMRQSDVVVPSAFSAHGARHCEVRDSKICQTGGWGVEFGDGCRHCRVEGCEMVDLGAGGIKLGMSRMDEGSDTFGPGTTFPDDPETLSSHNVAHDNLIAGIGRVHPGGCGVWVGNTPDNTVTHNEIYDVYGIGISVGWLWSYTKETPAIRNEIGWNHIHKIGQGVMSDNGGIYTLSICPGTRLHHNLIHDVFARSYGGWGIYFDQATSRIRAEYNVVYRTMDGGFNQHWGKGNVVENNLFVDGLQFQLRRNNTRNAHSSFRFHRNIVAWQTGELLGLPEQVIGHGFDFEYNLYWPSRGQAFGFDGRTLEQWQKSGQDLKAVIGDPGFANPDADDYHMPADSVAVGLGIDINELNATLDKAGQIGAKRNRPLPQVGPTFPTIARPAEFGRRVDLEM
jgi:hypothetical protein